MSEDLQPLLHDLVVAAQAPTHAWSTPDGQVRGHGAQGFFHADVRVLSQAVLRVAGVEPEPISGQPSGPRRASFTSLLRMVDGPGADPTATITRIREVSPGQVCERLELRCATASPIEAIVTISVASDLAAMELVRRGRGGPPLAPGIDHDGMLVWQRGDVSVRLCATGATVSVEAARAQISWRVVVAPGQATALTWDVQAEVPAAVVAPATVLPDWSGVRVCADDARVERLVARSLDDLRTLAMTSTIAPGETFLAAGAPWFFTLFGRDSLWAARMLLPLGTDLARGTLRTLAAAQGSRVDRDSAEQPGKILHEVRAQTLQVDERTALPPVYFGTVDATSLWVCLLRDAWRWGMAERDVAALLPNLERALAWMAEHGDSDSDGFLDYADDSGHGLSNQGWKDSGDSIQWRDGRLAEGPIALSEVQAYAHEAALAGAELLDAFGRPGAARWRTWAEGLAGRFRERFWVADEHGPYPAIALDARGHAVDSVASNMGHLLGTGLLDPREEALVAARLVAPDMSSGFGLRTLSSHSGGYWPLSYHGGSVWPHDTAIAVLGLARSGFHAQASELSRGILAAAERFGYRLPELYGGNPADEGAGPLPYPAACHPQAWSAAASIALVTALAGVETPERGEGLRCVPASSGSISVTGLRCDGEPWRVAVQDGRATAERVR